MVKQTSISDSSKEFDDTNTAEIVELMPHLIAVGAKKLSANAFTEVETWDDALALAQNTFGHLVSAEEAGDGTELIDKNDLVGVPFLIVNVSFSRSEFDDGRFYATARGITKDNRKFVVSDGSVGFCMQLAYLADKFNRRGGFLISKGLTRSDYSPTIVDPVTGKEKTLKATTFYLDTTPV